MKLRIKNIGKIEDAIVEFNGITVIAGENNSGKSTVGKVLYSVFNSFYKVEEQIYNEKKESLNRILYRGLYMESHIFRQINMFEIENDEIIADLLNYADKYIEDYDLLRKHLLNILIEGEDSNYITENIDDVTKKVIHVLGIPDSIILETLILKKMNVEFNGQINNIFSLEKEEGKIELTIRGEILSFMVKDNDISEISKKYSLNTEVIYIDDPYVLDDIDLGRRPLNRRNELNHREELKLKLVKKDNDNIIDEIIVNKRLDSILEKVNSVCSGDMIKNKNKFGYKKDNINVILDIKNISTGLKTFVIIKTLLQNGSLTENGTIILDEPEIHLHPEWQLILAELIVLIQKEFGMHILLNTHSPYFLRAIEVYSANYGIADKCKYYLSKNVKNIAVIEDVTMETDRIYEKLAKPLETLQIERYRND